MPFCSATTENPAPYPLFFVISNLREGSLRGGGALTLLAHFSCSGRQANIGNYKMQGLIETLFEAFQRVIPLFNLCGENDVLFFL